MNYENGFYIYTPSKDAEEGMHELSWHQVIKIIEGDVWLTGCDEAFDIDYANAVGTIGAMVMSQEGVVS